MESKLQGKAGQHNHDQLRVRDASHLPDRPCGAPCAKGTAQLCYHQHGKGRTARVGKVLVAIPLPCEGAQGYPGRETADTEDTLGKALPRGGRAAWGYTPVLSAVVESLAPA